MGRKTSLKILLAFSLLFIIAHPLLAADATPPVVTLSTPSGTNGWLGTGTFQISWSGSDSESAIKAVAVFRRIGSGSLLQLSTTTSGIGTKNVSGQYNESVSSSDSYYYQVKATDDANNEGSADGYVRVDLVSPNISISYPPNNFSTSSSQVTVQGTVSDNYSGIMKINFSKNGSPLQSIEYQGPAYPLSTPYSKVIDLDTGNNAIQAHAVDAAGHTSITSSVNVICTPPAFVSKTINPLVINNLGNEIVFSYRVNYDGYIRICISDDAGNEKGVVQNWTPIFRDTDYSASFNGSLVIDNILQLLENGSCYLKVQYYDNAGVYYKDPATNNLYYLSPTLTINIPRKSIAARVQTPPNPSNAYCNVPEVNLSFIKQGTPLDGVAIPAGDGTSTFEIPTSGLYQVRVEKQGYETRIFSGFDPATTSEFVQSGYRPYMPGEAGYLADVDSDGDGISDGWEYQHWISWQGWTSACGCDLSKADGSSDPDADGLQNLEEYRLQGKGFPDLNPRVRDLCVELDWVRSTDRSYEPDNNAKETCKLIFREAGVTLHYAASSQSNEIFRGDNLPNEPEVDLAQLRQMLRDSQYNYGDANVDGDIDVVQAIFAPGWTVIRDLTQTGNTSTGGLYLKNPGGVFVFDLHTRNVVAGRVEEDNTKSPLLGNYEGNILAHELGHVLGLQDRGE